VDAPPAPQHREWHIPIEQGHDEGQPAQRVGDLLQRRSGVTRAVSAVGSASFLPRLARGTPLRRTGATWGDTLQHLPQEIRASRYCTWPTSNCAVRVFRTGTQEICSRRCRIFAAVTSSRPTGIERALTPVGPANGVFSSSFQRPLRRPSHQPCAAQHKRAKLRRIAENLRVLARRCRLSLPTRAANSCKVDVLPRLKPGLPRPRMAPLWPLRGHALSPRLNGGASRAFL